MQAVSVARVAEDGGRSEGQVEIWQTAYHDQYNGFVKGRYPMAFIELSPGDAKSQGIEAGDVVTGPRRDPAARIRPWPGGGC